MIDLSFLNPVAALLGLAVIVPLAALLVQERRMERVRRRIGLRPPGRRAFLPVVLGWVVAFGLLGAAAAQPVIRLDGDARTRTDAEAFVVFDITRSMLAASDPGAPTRMQRAIESAGEIRALLSQIPVGVGTLTNRPLPHLFPTTDEQAFDRVVGQSIGVNRPPGSERGVFLAATDFASLELLASSNWFRPASVKRLAILLTDGETSAFSARILVSRLARAGVELVIVRFWRRDERVWRPNGQPEPGYRPLSSTLGLTGVADLAALTTGGRIFDETEVSEAVGAARRYLGEGPSVEAPTGGRTVSLARFAVLAACIPLALLLLPSLLPQRVARGGAGQGRLNRIAYSMVSAWRGSSTTAGRR